MRAWIERRGTRKVTVRRRGSGRKWGSVGRDRRLLPYTYGCTGATSCHLCYPARPHSRNSPEKEISLGDEPPRVLPVCDARERQGVIVASRLVADDDDDDISANAWHSFSSYGRLYALLILVSRWNHSDHFTRYGRV